MSTAGNDPGPTGEADARAAGEATGRPPAQLPAEAAKERTRTKVVFTSLVAGLVILILLLIFMLENTQSVKVRYFGAGGHIALGLALLLAAVGGGLLVAIAGSARVLQLRRRIKRHSK
jgi:uncharacterized integral membrane protein